MKKERNNVEFPLWRKKVDKTLFTEGTPLPNWAADMWSLPQSFSKVLRKKDPKSQIVIKFDGSTFNGNIVAKNKPTAKTSKVQYWLALDAELRRLLKHTFVMSYLRSIEFDLGGKDSEVNSPFWEFIDIEYDSDAGAFHFVAHYIQESYFPNLFKGIIESYVIERIELQNRNEGYKSKISKDDWKSKKNLHNELDSTNSLYTLLDTQNRELYVGETESMHSRFSAERKEIPGWDKYRVDVLPPELAPYRKEIERLMIRAMAALLTNEKGIPSMGISDYVLKNKKIDK